MPKKGGKWQIQNLREENKIVIYDPEAGRKQNLDDSYMKQISKTCCLELWL